MEIKTTYDIAQDFNSIPEWDDSLDEEKWVNHKDLKKELAELINIIPNDMSGSDQKLLHKIYEIKDKM